MKTALIALAMLLLCGGLFFIAPHHRRRDNSMHPCTLGGVYADGFGSMADWQTPRLGMFVFLGLAGLVASFYPVLLVLLTRWKTGGGGGGGGAAAAIFVLGGIVVLVGATVNFIVMLASHMSIGFGASSSSSGDETWFIFVIPLVQIAFALASIAIGVSSACAGWAGRLVRP